MGILTETLKERQERVMRLPFGAYGEAEYFSELAGKQVVIVGPAGYLRGKRRGKFIDSYDVIVKVNHAFPLKYKIDYGSRVDVLYHILSHRHNSGSGKEPISKEEIASWDCDWIVSRHDFRSSRVRQVGPYLAGRKWTAMSHEFWFSVKMSVGVRAPNTGISAIAHLLNSDLKELFVIGYDFYRSGVYTNYGDVKENEVALQVNEQWHNTEAQIKFLATLRERDNRLIFDEVLSAIVDEACTGKKKRGQCSEINIGDYNV